MTFFLLVFMVWTKMGPHPIPGVFPTRNDCQITEGELATMLEKDKSIIAWTVPTECTAVTQPKKA